MKTIQPLFKASLLLVLFLFIHKMPAMAQGSKPKEKQRVIIIQEKTDAKGNTSMNRVEQEVSSDAEAQKLIDKVLGESGNATTTEPSQPKIKIQMAPDGAAGDTKERKEIRIEKKLDTQDGDMNIIISDGEIFINGERIDQKEMGSQLEQLKEMPFFRDGMEGFGEFFQDLGEDGSMGNAKAYLGLGTQANSSATGLEITQVSPGSPADKSGLEEGDLLISINGKVLKSFDDLVAEVGNGKPGDEVQIAYQRDGKAMNTTAKLTRKNPPAPAQGRSMQINPDMFADLFSQFQGQGFGMPGAAKPQGPRLGVTIEAYDNGRTEGVLVKEVAKGSIAEIMDIRAGDIITHINNKEVEDVAAVQACVRELRGGDQLVMKLKRNKKKIKVNAVWPSDEKEKRRRNTSSF